jgi:hypothetical protein
MEFFFSSAKWAEAKWGSSHQQMAHCAFVTTATFIFGTAGRWNLIRFYVMMRPLSTVTLSAGRFGINFHFFHLYCLF